VLERRVMEPDDAALAGFYGTRAGVIARRAILVQLHRVWPNLAGYRLLGFGFTAPYLAAFGAERAIAAGTGVMGAVRWPGDLCASVQCEEDALPFADALFDRVLIVHGLERAEALRPLLRQLWRDNLGKAVRRNVLDNHLIERVCEIGGKPHCLDRFDRIGLARLPDQTREDHLAGERIDRRRNRIVPDRIK